jgi:hypothetical protein
MFCRWCAKERDPDSFAIHHCGSMSRPPAYCMQCGTALGAEATACAECGLAAGTEPAPVRVVVTADVVESAPPIGVAEAATDRSTSSAGVQPKTARAMRGFAPRPTSYGRDDLERASLLEKRRLGQVVSALVAVLGFFIPWFEAGFNFTGIVGVNELPWHWWGPPSPQVLFSLLLIALALSFLGKSAETPYVDRVTALVAFLNLVFVADWVWVIRGFYAGVTGFWIVVAASVMLFAYALLSSATFNDS